MMKDSTKTLRVLLIVLISLLLVAILAFGLILFKNRKPNDPIINNDPDVTETDDEKLNIDVLDYEVFADGKNEVGFNFVIARLRFTANGNKISYDLGNLVTSEHVDLSNGRYYSDKLSEKSYYLSSYNVLYSVKADSDSYTCRIVIPYSQSTDSLSISDQQGFSYEFDLTRNNVSIETLKYSSGSDITIGGSFEAYLSDAYITSTMYMNGEQMSYPSTVQVYTFKLHIKSVDEENVFVEAAEFVSDTLEDNVYYALDSSFESMKAENIINMPLHQDSEGALFFEVINVNGSDPDFKGTLRLRMSNQDEWIEISTK